MLFRLNRGAMPGLYRGMTRTITPALIALALAASPATAAPADLRDPSGDWLVASEDILRVRLERATVDGAPAVRAVVTLSAPADPAAAYFVHLGAGCLTWSLGTRGIGAEGPFLAEYGCDSNVRTPTLLSATAAVSGTDVVLTAPLAGRLRRGTTIGHLAAQSAPGMSVTVYHPGDPVTNGDYAAGSVHHVV